LKKISIRPLLTLLRKAQAVVQKTSRKNMSVVLIFTSFLSLWWTSWVENHNQL